MYHSIFDAFMICDIGVFFFHRRNNNMKENAVAMFDRTFYRTNKIDHDLDRSQVGLSKYTFAGTMPTVPY